MPISKTKSKIKWSQIKSLVRQGIKATEIERQCGGAVTAAQIYRRKAKWAKSEYYTSDKYKKYRTPEYVAWRTAVLIRDCYKCVVCGRGRPARLEVDHVVAFSVSVELRYEVSNGRVLCHYHHKRTPNYGFKACSYKNTIDPKVWVEKEKELWKLEQLKKKLKRLT